MSFDVKLLDKKGKICQVEKHTEGGTYVLGGTIDASLNITYNYSKLYSKYLDEKQGLRFLDGKKAKDVIERLRETVFILGIVRDRDYWKPTPGNAGYALVILLKWAKQHPEAMFKVS
ncbi:MAG: hypothetical protein ISS48_00710 [Candidatus Aenigmarchaeota archaeon]|nr:hypothetical protein [Candidatus Aenigmarchaeota archaeon]